MRMSGRTPSAAWTRSSSGLFFRLTLAIAGSSRPPQMQAVASLLDFLKLVVYPVGVVGSRRRSRHQVHGTDEEQDQPCGDEQAGDRPRDGTGGCPSPVVPERRDEDATARPEGCGPEGDPPPPFL